MKMTQQHRSTGLIALIRYEKERMLPLNFATSYIITPLYVVCSIALLAAFGTLMAKGSDRYLTPAMLCLAGMVLLSVALLMLVPYVRKKAIVHETERYDFDVDQIEDRNEWDFSDGEHRTVFNRYGLDLDGTLHYYNHIRKAVVTDNRCQRVNIALLFVIDEDTCGSVPLTAATLKVLRQFDIRLINQDTLDYIINHKEEAFRQIYMKGTVTVR